ncbi:hypothetical protein FOZ63_000463 [Perkinsus olseni]|uniref:Uncharacterized protein n=1 Tax=Perkinsus olseni TaxID=32597 RepID=A0A7J6SAD1_PEROL|nr:hypothetical protein FOZ63_000463 [Perkinsus olseni]
MSHYDFKSSTTHTSSIFVDDDAHSTSEEFMRVHSRLDGMMEQLMTYNIGIAQALNDEFTCIRTYIDDKLSLLREDIRKIVKDEVKRGDEREQQGKEGNTTTKKKKTVKLDTATINMAYDIDDVATADDSSIRPAGRRRGTSSNNNRNNWTVLAPSRLSSKRSLASTVFNSSTIGSSTQGLSSLLDNMGIPQDNNRATDSSNSTPRATRFLSNPIRNSNEYARFNSINKGSAGLTSTSGNIGLWPIPQQQGQGLLFNVNTNEAMKQQYQRKSRWASSTIYEDRKAEKELAVDDDNNKTTMMLDKGASNTDLLLMRNKMMRPPAIGTTSVINGQYHDDNNTTSIGMFLLIPDHGYTLVLNIISLTLSIYTVLVVPYNIAFGGETSDITWDKVLHMIVEMLFLLDIILNFRNNNTIFLLHFVLLIII